MSPTRRPLELVGVGAAIRFNWQRRGRVVPHFVQAGTAQGSDWHSISLSWPGDFHARAGLYRITVCDGNHRWIYIGEADFIARRLSDYQHLHTSESDGVPSRLTVLIRTALLNGEPVYLDTATVGKITIGGLEQRLAMRQKAHRIIAEAAAVLQEESLADENTWVMNKQLDDTGRYMYTTAWDLPDTPSPAE